MDGEGWVDVDELLQCCAMYKLTFSRAVLEQVVATDSKSRFTYSEDHKRIRAAQGHSIPGIAINFSEEAPPETLYHGTATRNLASIRRSGLIPGERLYVHMSTDASTALEVGRRYGVPVIIRIDAKKAHADGIQFFKSENGVWLAKNVPTEYLYIP